MRAQSEHTCILFTARAGYRGAQRFPVLERASYECKAGFEVADARRAPSGQAVRVRLVCTTFSHPCSPYHLVLQYGLAADAENRSQEHV